ncbi:MAG: peptide ABC transporter substrate-binding protein [Spirochaetales bacterium]
MNRNQRVGLISLTVLIVGAAFLGAQQNDDPFVVNFLPTEIEFNPIITYTTSEAQIYTGLYEGLVTYDPFSLDPIPAVASRWEILDDGLRYRFYLREDARYSNGDPVLADHFRSTWLSMLDPDTDAAYASLFDMVEGAQAYRNGENSNPDSVGIVVVADRILEIRLARRATHLLRILCHHSFVVVHPDMLERGGWDQPTEIPFNGPYVLAEITDPSVDGGTITLEENAEYWDARRIEIDTIRIDFNQDAEAVTSEFNEGSIDWVRGGIDFGNIERSEDLVINPLFATTYYQLSAHIEPFDDARVRRAFALALPWETIRDADVWFIPADSLVPEIPAYPEVTGIVDQDVDAALELLAEAGYPEGEGLPEIVITIPGELEDDVVAQAMVDTWSEAFGATVTASTVPYPRYFSYVEEEDFMVSTISWIGDFADPLTFLDMWTTASNLNNSRFQNSEYDALVRDASGLTGDERYQMLSEAERMLLEDGVVLPVSHSPSVNLISLDLVTGWYANPLDIHPFKYLAFASGGPIPYVASASRE